MASMVKTNLVPWHRRFQPFNLERKVWVIRETVETCLNSASKKYIRDRHFSSWDKIFVDQCYQTSRVAVEGGYVWEQHM